MHGFPTGFRHDDHIYLVAGLGVFLAGPSGNMKKTEGHKYVSKEAPSLFHKWALSLVLVRKPNFEARRKRSLRVVGLRLCLGSALVLGW